MFRASTFRKLSFLFKRSAQLGTMPKRVSYRLPARVKQTPINRTFATYSKQSTQPPLTRKSFFIPLAVVVGFNCLLNYDYFQESYQSIKLKKEHGESHETHLNIYSSKKALQEGNHFYSEILFELSVEKFSKLLSNASSCLQSNDGDMRQQLQVLWGTDDIYLILENMQKIANQIMLLSKQLTDAIENNCTTHCTDTKKSLALKDIEQLQHKISKFPFESFDPIYMFKQITAKKLDFFEKFMKEPFFSPKEEMWSFNDLAETCRQNYLLSDDPQTRQQIKEQFLKVSEMFLLKLNAEANQLGDEKKHQKECDQHKVNQIRKSALLAQSLLTLFESKVQLTTSSNKSGFH